MIYHSVCTQARTVSSLSLRTPLTGTAWRNTLTARRRMWLDMLGLWPLPNRTPLKATVTGLSGGAISWFLGAADERVQCVVPVCQTGSIEQLVTDRATDGHCDCAFWINYHQWCTPDIGSLIAPRALPPLQEPMTFMLDIQVRA